MRLPRIAPSALLAFAVLFLAACAGTSPRRSTTTTGATLTHDDLAWLRRDGFGINSADVARYRQLGRDGLLDAQLIDHVHGSLPPPVASLIQGFEAVHTPLPQLLADLHDTQQQARAMPAGPDKDAADKRMPGTMRVLWWPAE